MTAPEEKRILAIDPINRGFGFVVLEGPEYLVDWGVKEVPNNKNAHALWAIENLIGRYQPDKLVVEDYTSRDSRRTWTIHGCVSLTSLTRTEE